MSREFGSYNAGYFDQQMRNAADDLRAGEDELSRVWAGFFDEFHHVAYAIASSEASDSGADYPIMETINRLPALKEAISRVEQHVMPYKRIAEIAVLEHIAAAKGKP
jgi:hypothetical protein